MEWHDFWSGFWGGVISIATYEILKWVVRLGARYAASH
jgi:hypothetical protein